MSHSFSGKPLRLSPRIPLFYLQTLVAAALAISFGAGARGAPQVPAGNPAAASSAAGDAQSPAPKGSFFSSLKRAIKQELDLAVIRGHLDVGAHPDTYRYCCLVV